MLFVDTSALVNRYSEEVRTAVVDELIEDTDEPILVTSLTVIEMTSASRRKFNRGELTERQRDDVLIAFFEEATEQYTLIPIEAPVFELAFDLVLEDDRRTLDALQLGAALDAAGTGFSSRTNRAPDSVVDQRGPTGRSTTSLTTAKPEK